MAQGENFMFTKEQVDKATTIVEGWPPEKELYIRQLCASIILDIGQKLSLSQLCMNTSTVYMHRFYMFRSMQQFNYKIMSVTCLFLGAKAEEQPRKLEHVAKLGVQLSLRQEALTPVQLDGRVREYSEEIKYYENILLQTLGFAVQVVHPHSHVIKACQLIKASKQLTQISYSLATSIVQLTTLGLRYPVSLLACLSIYLACKWANYEVPLSNEGKPWFYYVNSSITHEQLETTCAEFINGLKGAPLKTKSTVLKYKDAAANGGQKLSSPADVPLANGSSNGHTLSSHDSHKTENAHDEAGSGPRNDEEAKHQKDEHHTRKRSHHTHKCNGTEGSDERPVKLPRMESTHTQSACVANGSIGVSPVVSRLTPTTSSASQPARVANGNEVVSPVVSPLTATTSLSLS